MKPIRFDRIIVGLAVLLGVSAGARAESLASIFTNAQTQAIPERRTSIILIQCHGLGYGDLSCYGQTNYSTPNLDRLAAGGIRFTGYHPASPEFTPALAALMTGKSGRFAPGTTLVARRLQAAGYHTGLIGEWTLSEQPWTQGFNEFAGFLDENEGRNYFSDYLWRYAPKSIYNETNRTMSDFSGKEELYPNTAGKKEQYLPELLVNVAVNFVHNHNPEWDNHYKPFFLVVNYPVPRSATAGADDFPVPSDAPFSDEKWPQAAKNRAALITRIDGGIGRVLEELEKHKQTNDYAIFFSSSAAPEKFANTNLNFLKPNGDQTASGDAVAPAPMIVYWPQVAPAGGVISNEWSSVDFAPTVLEMGYAHKVPGLDGTSILPLLTGQVETNRVETPH